MNIPANFPASVELPAGAFDHILTILAERPHKEVDWIIQQIRGQVSRQFNDAANADPATDGLSANILTE